MISHYAKSTPDNPAIIYEKCNKKLTCTYMQLKTQVESRASELKLTGKTCMGVLADGSFDCIINIFAANIVGMQIVMLDESMSTEILQKLVLLTDIDILCGDQELVLELNDFLTKGVDLESANDKIMFFTSGTTNLSKAVILSGHSFCQSAFNGSAKLPLGPNDTLMCMLPLAHVFGFVCGFLWGLSCGASVALGRGVRHYVDDMEFFHPTVFAAVPTLLEFLMSHNLVNQEAKLVLVGAGDCSPKVLEAAKNTGLRVSFGYGLTETSSGVAISVSGDPYAMEICPDDTITIADDGEVLIDAPTCIMQGYYKDPISTSEVLKNNVLYTGDLGKLDENGCLHIIGRKKEMLVLPDGTKIFLPEYEGHLTNELGTTELAVIMKNGKPCLVYYGNMSEDIVKNQLIPLMQDYPRGQQIAEVIKSCKPIPRTATGKIKRWELMNLV